MKYFLIHTDTNWDVTPEILHWREKIKLNYICKEKQYLLPKRELLEIRSNSNTVFPDIVSSPFFMVTKTVGKMVHLYDPSIKMKEVILLDGPNQLVQLYFLPILETIDCLSESSELNLDRSMIKKAVFNSSKLEDRPIFRIGVIKSMYIAVRLDLAESILKRGCRGVGLTPVEME